MYGDLEGIRVGAKPGPTPRPLMGEAKYSA